MSDERYAEMMKEFVKSLETNNIDKALSFCTEDIAFVMSLQFLLLYFYCGYGYTQFILLQITTGFSGQVPVPPEKRFLIKFSAKRLRPTLLSTASSLYANRRPGGPLGQFGGGAQGVSKLKNTANGTATIATHSASLNLTISTNETPSSGLVRKYSTKSTFGGTGGLR